MKHNHQFRTYAQPAGVGIQIPPAHDLRLIPHRLYIAFRYIEQLGYSSNLLPDIPGTGYSEISPVIGHAYVGEFIDIILSHTVVYETLFTFKQMAIPKERRKTGKRRNSQRKNNIKNESKYRLVFGNILSVFVTFGP